MPAYRPQTKYIIVLSVVAGLILIIGARFRPKEIPEAPQSQSEMRRLQLASQQRNLDDLTSYFTRVAEQVKPRLVWVRGLEASGVVWDDEGGIVTPGPRNALSRTPTAGRFTLTPEVVSLHYPVGAFRAPADAGYGTFFRGELDNLRQGGWVIQVTAKRDGGHLYAPGTFEGLVSVECGGSTVRTVETNLPLDETSAGGGLFDLRGDLLAVVVRCDTGYAAVTPEGVDRVLAGARSFSGQLLRWYGLHAEPLSEELQQYFVTNKGLIVTEVWCNWPADRAGIVPGDIIQSLDGTEVNTTEDLRRLLLPVAYPSFELGASRAGKKMKLTVAVSKGELPMGSETGGPGIQLRSGQPGYTVDEITPGSRAEQAEVARGDQLLLIGGQRPRSLSAAEKVLAEGTDDPVYIVLQRDRIKLGAFLR
jgi:S1-C subfamily serine protease